MASQREGRALEVWLEDQRLTSLGLSGRAARLSLYSSKLFQCYTVCVIFAQGKLRETWGAQSHGPTAKDSAMAVRQMCKALYTLSVNKFIDMG